MVLPHEPLAEKLNDCTTVEPAATKPYVCGPLGPATPLLGSSVATRFVAGPVPMFFNAKLITTTSPGSIAPFVGLQPSDSSVVESSTTTGLLFTSTENAFVALNGGDPSSTTFVLKKLLELFCDRFGVHVITPLNGLIDAPVGGLISE